MRFVEDLWGRCLTAATALLLLLLLLLLLRLLLRLLLLARVDPRTTTTSVRELTGTELAAWAPGLKLEIVKALETFDDGGAKISKLTPEQS